jgi:hypothetical protein
VHVDKTTATRRYVLSPRRAAAVLGAGVLLCLAAMSARSVYATMPSAPSRWSWSPPELWRSMLI